MPYADVGYSLPPVSFNQNEDNRKMSIRRLSEQQNAIIRSVWISPTGLDSPEGRSCKIFAEMSFMKICVRKGWPLFSFSPCWSMAVLYTMTVFSYVPKYVPLYRMVRRSTTSCIVSLMMWLTLHESWKGTIKLDEVFFKRYWTGYCSINNHSLQPCEQKSSMFPNAEVDSLQLQPTTSSFTSCQAKTWLKKITSVLCC